MTLQNLAINVILLSGSVGTNEKASGAIGQLHVQVAKNGLEV